MNDNGAPFLGGFILSIFGNLNWIHSLQVRIMPGNIYSEFFLDAIAKMGGTMILGVIGGLAGLFAKDLYKTLKDKFNKHK